MNLETESGISTLQPSTLTRMNRKSVYYYVTKISIPGHQLLQHLHRKIGKLRVKRKYSEEKGKYRLLKYNPAADIFYEGQREPLKRGNMMASI
nr:hypothetical transcript [Hymenolepis microstoma]